MAVLFHLNADAAYLNDRRFVMLAGLPSVATRPKGARSGTQLYGYNLIRTSVRARAAGGAPSLRAGHRAFIARAPVSVLVIANTHVDHGCY